MTKIKRIIALVLCVCFMFSTTVVGAFATEETPKEDIGAQIGDFFAKGFYDTLNAIVEVLVKGICAIYPNPKTWERFENYSADEIGFMAGRDTYQTEAKDSNVWSLGYASKSLVPEDIDSGKYNIGRDLLNKYASGVYDDQRIRVTAIDDGSGEGLAVFGAVDSMGVTSTDTRTIRKAVLAYFEAKGIEIASITIAATHTHSALDTQGVSTEFFRKLAGGAVFNLFGIESTMPGLETAESFKEFFIAQSIAAVIEAVEDMEEGKLYFSAVDCSKYIKDKRELISKEDIPETAVLYFDAAQGEDTYIADISCHPTSFSASHGLVSSDYIYYLDKYIKETTGANFLMVPGAIGQLSRDNIDVDTTAMDEWEEKGAGTKFLGEAFAKLILAADYSLELEPILNVKHRELFISPENSILTLACEINLVNNRVFTKGILGEPVMATEMGYIEFGGKVAFALFPGELYPETFWDDEITGAPSWDGTSWPYDSLAEAKDGIDIYCVSLANDAIGYVLTDNNFAFMGHIIGDGIADEVLSVGKHTGSLFATEFAALIDSLD